MPKLCGISGNARANSKFKESDRTTTTFEDGIQVITLEDDDFQTMEIIMNAIHLQSHLVPRKVTFQQLDDIAILCDKYDLRRSLGPWPDLWSEDHLALVQIEGFERWLFIASAFENAKVHIVITRRLILNAGLSEVGELIAIDPTFSVGVPASVIGESAL